MRLGLKPIVRRVWAPRGRRPTARFRRRYEWLYLYGFVRPKSGEVFWLILPAVNVEVFSLALSHFAKEVGASPDKHILLVLDQAGWHTGGKVEVPEGIHLEFLPARSPELQPAERLWPLANEAVANRLFEELDGLEEALVKRCVALLEQRPSSSALPRSTTGGPMRHSNRGASTRKLYELSEIIENRINEPNFRTC